MTSATPKGNAGEITFSAGDVVMEVPQQTRVTRIGLQEFHLLMEGAGSPRGASVRDSCIGIAVTAGTTAISLWCSTNLTVTHNGQKIPVWGPFLTVIILAMVTLVTVVIAILGHKVATGDAGRRSYSDLLARMRRELGVSDS